MFAIVTLFFQKHLTEMLFILLQQSSSCATSAWNVKERNWVDQIPSALKFLAGSGNGKQPTKTRSAFANADLNADSQP